MSAPWSQGYFTDSTYTYGYYRELSPVFLRFCCLAKGYLLPTNLNKPLTYCELGFGQGVSVNIHAAAVPSVVHATDFNPIQVNFAQDLASSYAGSGDNDGGSGGNDAGSGGNSGSSINLYDKNFAEMLDLPGLPQFDIIGLHGIWSWISPENRDYIIKFVHKHLKVGGAFYISYNCLPGWSNAAPLRQIFRLHDKFMGDSFRPEQRMAMAMEFTQKLLEAKPLYAVTTPQAIQRFESIKTQNSAYLGHEYLNEHWDLMYFSEVADLLSPAKLSFVASANPLDNVVNLGLSGEAVEFLGGIDNPIMRGQMRDYFINTQFRKDIYIRGGQALHGAEQRELLLEEVFVLLQEPDAVKLEIKAGMGQINLKEEIYRPILQAMAQNNFKPKRMVEILSLVQAANLDFAQVLSALVILVGCGAVSPCQHTENISKAKPNTDKLNASIFKKACYSQELSFAASPVTGGGQMVGRMEQLFLLAGLRKENPVNLMVQVLLGNGERLIKNGVVLNTVEEHQAYAQELYTDFEVKRLPLLRAWGMA